jgi:hypothetical protein
MKGNRNGEVCDITKIPYPVFASVDTISLLVRRWKASRYLPEVFPITSFGGRDGAYLSLGIFFISGELIELSEAFCINGL